MIKNTMYLIKEKTDNQGKNFAKQFSLINSDSSLPSELQKKMNNSLYSVRFSTEDIKEKQFRFY